MTRTTTETFVFTHPFLLNCIGQELSAGAYLVETESEMIPSLSFVAYRRTQTFLHLPRRGNTRQSIVIDPEEFAAAFAHDQAQQGPNSLL